MLMGFSAFIGVAKPMRSSRAAAVKSVMHTFDNFTSATLLVYQLLF
jgi:hypothetical protein